MNKFIGIYGGSFDPIHLGHLNLATEMMETHQLDEVWFFPAASNPHKTHQTSANAFHRMNMIRLAIEQEPRFLVSDIETNRPMPSYTIDTLNELIVTQKQQQTLNDTSYTFALLLGDDAAQSFHLWHQPEAIVNIAQLFIGRRQDENKSFSYRGSPLILEAINRGLTHTRIMEISSSEIRKRLFNRQYCYHLIPGKVMDYIITNRLYSSALNEARFL